ncbi:ATP-binding cassette domain-containing protein [Alkalicoccus luteus]|uniref:ATP-binding cassette domain-containing protein n=1 Tax=Alkalicoccus luteus TaxID=1237094 RepID=UPI004033454A
MTLLQAENLHVSFKNEEVLHDISFTMKQGSIYGLIGRNGAGKTTLLSVLASYRQADSGKVLINGSEPFENEALMPKVAFLYETDYSDETETGLVLLKLAARYQEQFDLEYATKLAAKLELPLDKPVHKLSTGKQAALNVTLGLASRAPVTIFDEVYSGMDAPTRDTFYKELLDEQERHPRIIILSTHLVSEMDYLFDHVLMIHEGRMLLDEPVDALLERGFSVTGDHQRVEAFAAGRNVISEQRLGGTKSVMIFEELTAADTARAYEDSLDIGQVALQDLFIQLTGKGGQAS